MSAATALPPSSSRGRARSEAASLNLRVRRSTVRIAADSASLLEEFPLWRIPEVEAAAESRPEHTFFLETRHWDGESPFRIYYGRRRVARARCQSEALERLLSEMQVRVAESAQEEIFVHSGVIGWKGQAILFPGRSYAGKTTLVLEFLRRGATYYSDEYAVFDRRGRVHPYPRPLQVRRAGLAPAQVCRPEELGAAVGAGPLNVALILFARYAPQSRWRARRLTAGNALLGLLANTVCARKRPGEALSSLRPAVAAARCYRASRGEAAEAVSAILSLL